MIWWPARVGISNATMLVVALLPGTFLSLSLSLSKYVCMYGCMYVLMLIDVKDLC